MKKSGDLNNSFEYELFENQQDVDLREKLAVLYATPFTDILWWQLHDPSLMNHEYYKLFYYERSVLKHIILFKYFAKPQKKIYVLNKEFKISLKDVVNICHILFYEFDKVQQIIFEKIFEPEPKQSSKMVFEKTSNDVIILDLPKSLNAYLKSLDTKTFKEIRRKINGIIRDFPDFKVHYLEKDDILFEQIKKLVSFNRTRMKSKGIISQLNDTACKILHQYASTSGFSFLCLCTIDDKIIGGQIFSIIGEHAYAHVISHDNSYSKNSVGQITMINAIKYLIEEKNIKYFHLLCGTQGYKFRHGGINHDQYTIRVFRNNDIYYFFGKIMGNFRNNYKKFKQRLKNNKTIYSFYIKFNKMKMQGI